MSKRSLVSLLLLGFLVSAARADTIHVPVDQPTIAAGLGAANPGDTVLVACGVYDEWGLAMASGVVLRSETGLADCATIDAGANSRVMGIADAAAGTRIEGITFTNGSMSGGAGIHISHSIVTLVDCKFVGNSAGSYGGAAYVRYEDTEAVFEGCWFQDNNCELDGGAIFAWGVGSLTISGCTFADNYAGRDGGGVLFNYVDATLVACTFDANTAVQNGGATTLTHSAVSLERCLVTGGQNGSALFEYSDSSYSLNCCDLFGNAGGDYTPNIADQLGQNGNISEDPQYCGEPGSFNYLLEPDSPCATDHAPCGLHIGAWDVGCTGTATEPSSWGRVKSLY